MNLAGQVYATKDWGRETYGRAVQEMVDLGMSKEVKEAMKEAEMSRSMAGSVSIGRDFS